MLAQSLRVSRSVISRSIRQPTVARTFMASAPRSADIVQTIYLNALRDYKPAAEKASDSEGQVKKWAVPATPKAPESADAAFVSTLAEYEAAAVEIEGQAETSATGEPVKEEKWFVEEEEEEVAHH
ncbi:hypothetical protein EX30DRAFT_340739 [Ascodesmis nigricans]|uniref:Uncharacterized protein n=1 Tax=Ascodesmis nigricans TaxID=341454 RepID=A0A4S2MXM2_9PEZI|nr:hypothetical protein EX30DRAFT_340739 [Ascodesmis nigricans]